MDRVYVELGLKPIRSLLRKQPILTTVLIAGTVDGFMGAVEDNTSLALFGFLLAMTGLLGLTFSVAQRSQINHLGPANINRLDLHPVDGDRMGHQLPPSELPYSGQPGQPQGSSSRRD